MDGELSSILLEIISLQRGLNSEIRKVQERLTRLEARLRPTPEKRDQAARHIPDFVPGVHLPLELVDSAEDSRSPHGAQEKRAPDGSEVVGPMPTFDENPNPDGLFPDPGPLHDDEH